MWLIQQLWRRECGGARTLRPCLLYFQATITQMHHPKSKLLPQVRTHSVCSSSLFAMVRPAGTLGLDPLSALFLLEGSSMAPGQQEFIAAGRANVIAGLRAMEADISEMPVHLLPNMRAGISRAIDNLERSFGADPRAGSAQQAIMDVAARLQALEHAMRPTFNQLMENDNLELTVNERNAATSQYMGDPNLQKQKTLEQHLIDVRQIKRDKEEERILELQNRFDSPCFEHLGAAPAAQDTA